jgi:hypothetical protein
MDDNIPIQRISIILKKLGMLVHEHVNTKMSMQAWTHERMNRIESYLEYLSMSTKY